MTEKPKVRAGLHRSGRPPLQPGRVSFLLVLALFLMAFFFRAWGARFGLPDFYHPDEHAIVERAAAIL